MMTIGFIGVGVMGEPMCRNLITRSAETVLVFDRVPEPVDRLVTVGAEAAASIAEVGERCEVVLLSLPGGPELEAVAADLVAAMGGGSVVVDLTTAPVDLTRRLAGQARERGVGWVDAPVARTREAAEAGTLAVMVGGDEAVIERVRPLLATFGTDISVCGPVGCGQIAKILNNYVLFQNVVALGEAITIARRSGMDPARLIEVIGTGSGDSFALRNHATRAMLPGDFPLKAFSADYARKDLSYGLQLAAEAGVEVPGAELADRLLKAASDAGHGDEYWPTLLRIIDT
ncbi:MAG: NAD(P)-dependent oxidoreductase [Actinomycetia bacterium]|nr:NAD(P)-dependent oxidoreductase [Actinomycetes bacterium]MCP4085619.1 NAD(P)-dependent oxidoreductase [Actinomycetes bacterium]